MAPRCRLDDSRLLSDARHLSSRHRIGIRVAILRDGVGVARSGNGDADGTDDSAQVPEVRAGYFRERRLLVRRRSHCPSGLRAASYGEPRRTSTSLQALLRPRGCRVRDLRPELPAARAGIRPGQQSRPPLSELPRGSHRERSCTPVFLRAAARGIAMAATRCAGGRRQTDPAERVRSRPEARCRGRRRRAPRYDAPLPR